MSALTLKTEGDTHVIVTRRFAAPECPGTLTASALRARSPSARFACSGQALTRLNCAELRDDVIGGLQQS